MRRAGARRGRARRLIRYLAWSAVVVAATLALGWPFLEAGGRRGLLLAGTVAFLVQAGSFAALTTVSPGTGHFIGVWIGGTLVRFSVIGGSAFLVTAMESVSVTVALFGMAGLFLPLMLLELWMIRDGR